MLFRILAVLLLCSSLGMCATLSLYQTETKEDEEAAAVATPAADGHVGDSSDTNSFFGDNLLAKVLGVDNQGGSQPEVEADGATVREPGNDSDKPATESLIKEAVNQRPPSEEEANDIRPVQANKSQNKPQAQEDENSWSFNSIRNSFQNVHGYFDSLVELVGGRNGICQYRCRYGELPLPRPGYQQAEPNGCSSSLVGFQLDMGIPAMTTCCNQLDTCYDTCGLNKYDCDAKFRSCLLSICSDLKKSLGFVSKVQACESVADTLYNTVWTFGCRPYMNSQRAACVCQEEDKDEL